MNSALWSTPTTFVARAANRAGDRPWAAPEIEDRLTPRNWQSFEHGVPITPLILGLIFCDQVHQSVLGSVSVWIFWHQFELPKCQVHFGNAAVYLNVNFDEPIVYVLHFTPKTGKRTIDDLYTAAFEALMMFSHATIRFSYGLRLPGAGKLDSIISAR